MVICEQKHIKILIFCLMFVLHFDVIEFSTVMYHAKLHHDFVYFTLVQSASS